MHTCSIAVSGVAVRVGAVSAAAAAAAEPSVSFTRKWTQTSPHIVVIVSNVLLSSTLEQN